MDYRILIGCSSKMISFEINGDEAAYNAFEKAKELCDLSAFNKMSCILVLNGTDEILDSYNDPNPEDFYEYDDI